MTGPLSEQERTLLYSLIARRRSVRDYDDSAIQQQTLMRMLDGAQGVTDQDGGRGAPSAHALHPLGLTVIARRIQDLAPAIYGFDPDNHQLNRQAELPAAGSLLQVSLADDVWLESAAAIIVITADHERALRHFADQQSDGQRGARYIDVEAGAVAQSLYLATLVEGLGGVLVMGVDDQALARLLPLPSGHRAVALFCLGQCRS
ncbi:hypothetical protein W822_00260 [Advenella kashmirensis W13003]|uniref:Nitroreductase domain-containing protein n=1 Tax=Advenella kashmirensis W13003 TaxID=1424334 RepID=V8QYZ7_9BURK|nr:SagB/ThcOx family dehydrogenase [Advenella kashmirensis]ETF04618.1 hypothetical protein W822_00260 [Advenella kashmirensis W13003]